jgi:hypothetical protein
MRLCGSWLSVNRSQGGSPHAAGNAAKDFNYQHFVKNRLESAQWSDDADF